MTRPTVAERLARGAVEDANGCLVWQKCVNSRGYSQIGVGGKVLLGHRVAWELVNGPIPDGMTIDHLCKNKRCIAVAHLEVVTAAENTRRGGKEPRQTPRCANGHGRVGGNSASVAPDCTVCAKTYDRQDVQARIAKVLDRPVRAAS